MPSFTIGLSSRWPWLSVSFSSSSGSPPQPTSTDSWYTQPLAIEDLRQAVRQAELVPTITATEYSSDYHFEPHCPRCDKLYADVASLRMRTDRIMQTFEHAADNRLTPGEAAILELIEAAGPRGARVGHIVDSMPAGRRGANDETTPKSVMVQVSKIRKKLGVRIQAYSNGNPYETRYAIDPAPPAAESISESTNK